MLCQADSLMVEQGWWNCFRCLWEGEGVIFISRWELKDNNSPSWQHSYNKSSLSHRYLKIISSTIPINPSTQSSGFQNYEHIFLARLKFIAYINISPRWKHADLSVCRKQGVGWLTVQTRLQLILENQQDLYEE